MVGLCFGVHYLLYYEEGLLAVVYAQQSLLTRRGGFRLARMEATAAATDSHPADPSD